MPRASTRKRKQWIDRADKKLEKPFNAALESLRRGEHNKCISKALRAHNLPTSVYNTLRNRYLDITKERGVARMFLSPELELELVDWVKFLGYVKVPVCTTTIEPMAMDLAGKVPSRNWLAKFMKRHDGIIEGFRRRGMKKYVTSFDYPAAKKYYEKVKKEMLKKKANWELEVPFQVDREIVQGFVDPSRRTGQTSPDASEQNLKNEENDDSSSDEDEDGGDEDAEGEDEDASESVSASGSDSESDRPPTTSLDQPDHMPNNRLALRSASPSRTTTNASSSSSSSDPVDDLLAPVNPRHSKRVLLDRIAELQNALRILRDEKREAANATPHFQGVDEPMQENNEAGEPAHTATSPDSQLGSNQIFTGTLTLNKSKDELVAIGRAIAVDIGGTKIDIIENIKTYFNAHPEEKLSPRFAQLFKPYARAQKRIKSEPVDTVEENVLYVPAPPPQVLPPYPAFYFACHPATYGPYTDSHLQLHPQMMIQSALHYDPVCSPPPGMYPDRQYC